MHQQLLQTGDEQRNFVIIGKQICLIIDVQRVAIGAVAIVDVQLQPNLTETVRIPLAPGSGIAMGILETYDYIVEISSKAISFMKIPEDMAVRILLMTEKLNMLSGNLLAQLHDSFLCGYGDSQCSCGDKHTDCTLFCGTRAIKNWDTQSKFLLFRVNSG